MILISWKHHDSTKNIHLNRYFCVLLEQKKITKKINKIQKLNYCCYFFLFWFCLIFRVLHIQYDQYMRTVFTTPTFWGGAKYFVCLTASRLAGKKCIFLLMFNLIFYKNIGATKSRYFVFIFIFGFPLFGFGWKSIQFIFSHTIQCWFENLRFYSVV